MNMIDIIVLLFSLVLLLILFVGLFFCHAYEVILKEQKKKDVSDTGECPLKKNKNDSTEETAKEKKEDVESSNENRKEIV